MNVHVYNKKLWKDGNMHRSNIKVELIKLNPYAEVTQAEFVGIGRGQEFTAFHFTLDDEGEVIKLSSEREPLIGAKSVYGVENQTNELDIQSNRAPASGMTVEEAQRWIHGATQ